MQNIFLIGDEICWECASGFHWDTGSNDCEPDCGVSGDTCTGFIQDECCVAQNLYCSQFGRGGEPITPGQYHCCLEGDYWDVGLGQCRNEELCYNPESNADIFQISHSTRQAHGGMMQRAYMIIKRLIRPAALPPSSTHHAAIPGPTMLQLHSTNEAY